MQIAIRVIDAAEEVCVAVVTVDDALQELIGALTAALRSVSQALKQNVSELRVFNYNVAFYGYEFVSACDTADDTEEFSTAFYDRGWAVVPDAVDVTALISANVECTELAVYGNEFGWHALIGETSISSHVVGICDLTDEIGERRMAARS